MFVELSHDEAFIEQGPGKVCTVEPRGNVFVELSSVMTKML
jgi:hypothetical protein